MREQNQRQNLNRPGGCIVKAFGPEEEDVKLINRYTRSPVTPEQVYTFSVTLCDNEADRDHEAFDTQALESLAALFVGKTGIFDHDRSSRSQTARIYRTGVEYDKARRNCFGQVYARLRADAYIPRTESNADIIGKIDSGILKEVSVGCSVKRSVCSLCGKEKCGHVKGREYGGETCVRILKDPMDAYEFSFVAVPAQRSAGVMKNYQERETAMTAREKLKNLSEGEEITLSFNEAKELKEAAEWGQAYREKLSDSVKKYSRIVQPKLSERVLSSITESLSLWELSEMEETYKRMAGEALPLEPQLTRRREEPAEELGGFRI